MLCSGLYFIFGALPFDTSFRPWPFRDVEMNTYVQQFAHVYIGMDGLGCLDMNIVHRCVFSLSLSLSYALLGLRLDDVFMYTEELKKDMVSAR